MIIPLLLKTNFENSDDKIHVLSIGLILKQRQSETIALNEQQKMTIIVTSCVLAVTFLVTIFFTF